MATYNQLKRTTTAQSDLPTSVSSSGSSVNSGFQYGNYQESAAVQQAEAMLNQHVANKPGEYQSQWQNQLDKTLNQILNREKFSYDLNGDALYQQYKDQYITQGRQAMMDAMGQAAALTGGYSNSYAQTVGQQTYQGYLQQLNEVVPELYQLALDQYNREGDELYNHYGLFADREAQDYGRYRDSMTDWQSDRDYYTDRYNSERDYDYGKYIDNRDFSYGQYVDDRNFSYQKETDDRAYDYQLQQDQLARDEAVAQLMASVGDYSLLGKLYGLTDDQVALLANGGKETAYYNGGSGGGSYNNQGYGIDVVKQAQAFVGASADGMWGSNSAAAAKKMGYNSLADVVAAMGDVGTEYTATADTDSFELTLTPESRYDAIMRNKWGSYRNYVAQMIDRSSLTENEKLYLLSKYGVSEADLR